MRGGSKETQTLVKLEHEIAELDRRVIETVHRLTLVSGAQIRRLHFETSGNGRNDGQRARRALLRLSRLGLLVRMERRIGGKKFGSEGFCYRLGAEGQRLMSWWDQGAVTLGRVRPEPGARFVQHRLAVSELYVCFIEASRAAGADKLEVLEFAGEPDSWRTFDGLFGGRQRILKPDGFLKLGVGEFEHWWFCELDLGTVSRRARESQAAAYRSYWRCAAAESVMPRVLWITQNELVAERARAAIQPSGEPHGLFVVTTLANAITAATTPSQGASA
jgi:Replication-relaxation